MSIENKNTEGYLKNSDSASIKLNKTENLQNICIEKIVTIAKHDNRIETIDYPNLMNFRCLLFLNCRMNMLNLQTKSYITELQDRRLLRLDKRSLNSLHVKIMLKHINFTEFSLNLDQFEHYQNLKEEARKVLKILYDFHHDSLIYEWYSNLKDYFNYNLRM